MQNIKSRDESPDMHLESQQSTLRTPRRLLPLTGRDSSIVGLDPRSE